jgi:hypothetical protein
MMFVVRIGSDKFNEERWLSCGTNKFNDDVWSSVRFGSSWLIDWPPRLGGSLVEQVAEATP